MKKLLTLILAILLCTAGYAEKSADQPALPERILSHEEASVPLTEALTIAKKTIAKTPAQSVIRAELAELSDGAKAWVVTVFDTADFASAWCVLVDAVSGSIISTEAGADGFFQETHAAWIARKGVPALWSMEDKQRYDALYAMQVVYGLPAEGDMSAEKALTAALTVLGLPSADGYEVGYGYLMGGEGYNGVWEISLVRDGVVACQVNLDAVTGEIYYLLGSDEAGNG